MDGAVSAVYSGTGVATGLPRCLRGEVPEAMAAKEKCAHFLLSLHFVFDRDLTTICQETDRLDRDQSGPDAGCFDHQEKVCEN